MNLEQSINFLNKSESNFIEIVRDDLKQYIPSQDNKRVYIQNIPGANLEAYIKSYVVNNYDDVVVMIQHKTISGNSVRSVGLPYHIKVKGINPPAPVPAPAPVTAQAETVHHATPMPAPNQGLGMPFGLGFADVVGMSVKAERLEDVKQQLIETKEELKTVRDDAKEERRRLERKIESLEDELRVARSELAIKEKEKDLAVLEVKANQKGFLDSEGGQKVLDTLGGLGQAFMEAKAGTMGSNNPALGMAGLSETKAEFIQYVSENCDDDQVNYLGSIVASMQNPLFSKDLTNLIKKYNHATG